MTTLLFWLFAIFGLTTNPGECVPGAPDSEDCSVLPAPAPEAEGQAVETRAPTTRRPISTQFTDISNGF